MSASGSRQWGEGHLTGEPNGRSGAPVPPGYHVTHSDMSGSAGSVVQARDIGGGVHFHSSHLAAGPRPGQLPGEARGFVNRVQELESLDAAVASPVGGEAGPLRLALIVGTAACGQDIAGGPLGAPGQGPLS